VYTKWTICSSPY